jgi:hypothetical protein
MSLLYADSPDLKRDPDHLYWRDRENLLGVSEVETTVGLESDEWFTEEHSTRGIAVHADLAAVARGGKPFAFIDPDLYGWRQSGLDWLARALADGAIILGVEVMRYHALYRFAGTLDLVILWRGYEWILDWKTGKASKVTRFKLAAYDLLLGPASNGKPRKRAALELDRDGGQSNPVEYNTPEHFHDGNRFLGHLSTARDLRQFAPNRS